MIIVQRFFHICLRSPETKDPIRISHFSVFIATIQAFMIKSLNSVRRNGRSLSIASAVFRRGPGHGLNFIRIFSLILFVFARLPFAASRLPFARN